MECDEAMPTWWELSVGVLPAPVPPGGMPPEWAVLPAHRWDPASSWRPECESATGRADNMAASADCNAQTDGVGWYRYCAFCRVCEQDRAFLPDLPWDRMCAANLAKWLAAVARQRAATVPLPHVNVAATEPPAKRIKT